LIISKANHNKFICGHDKHDDGISSYLCIDVMSEREEEEEEKKKEKRVTFSFTLSVPIGICNLFFFYTHIHSLPLLSPLLMFVSFK
jgi:hypothetical protein